MKQRIPVPPKANVTDLSQEGKGHFWHWLGFHKWTKWTEPEERFNSYSDSIGHRSWLQTRQCKICNKYQVRKIREWDIK